jgi:hypothetical protein
MLFRAYPMDTFLEEISFYFYSWIILIHRISPSRKIFLSLFYEISLFLLDSKLLIKRKKCLSVPRNNARLEKREEPILIERALM